ncbi:helix-turn-helix transcriptional regulator [Bacillus sp. SM2101]|uniref:helix-turn-helix transcriptional regulator n=1 Tax=Bacillus sp. SM2101 TaxID=2805366 RepID=UPI001BDE08AF|nr:helix-turn-helix transcriptional regulator [Bacillus sp. SM2101]
MKELYGITIENEHEAVWLIRKRCNLSQFQFAEELGISKQLLCIIENDGHKITSKTRYKIESFLKHKYHNYIEGMKE